MNRMQETAVVEKEYATSGALDIRRGLHVKYSTNQEDFHRWVLRQYAFAPDMRILELGCGTAEAWKDADFVQNVLPEKAQLILSDFSPGMLETAQKNVQKKNNISFRQIDIQTIPYEDGVFDAVIANMMLYHVPDLPKALSEVRRVLKPGGIFYCATFGENGLMGWLCDALGLDRGKEQQNSFSLQNGKASLMRYFSRVEMRAREDGLAVTSTEDLVDYVLSTAAFSDVKNRQRQEIYRLIDRFKVDGVIHIPKEYGMFVCRV